jgi:hypothetical protein
MDPDPRSPVNSNRAGDVTLSLSFPGSTGVELGVRKGAIHIAVELGELAFDVVCGQQQFQRSAPVEIVLWAATRRQARRRPPIAKGSRIFSSAEMCRHVARRMSLIASSAGCFSGPDFCLIFAPCGFDDPEILPR